MLHGHSSGERRRAGAGMSLAQYRDVVASLPGAWPATNQRRKATYTSLWLSRHSSQLRAGCQVAVQRAEDRLQKKL